MDFYSAIPKYAAMFYCTCDEFINVYALIVLGVFAGIGVAIDWGFELGGAIRRVITYRKKK